MADLPSRAGRPAKSAEKLSRERVLEAALSLAQKQGVEAISFRRLSQDLKVTAMAVSYHAGNRKQMLSDLVRLAFEDVSGGETGGSAEENLRRLLSAYCSRALQHSSLVRAMLADPTLMSSDITALTDEIRKNTQDLNDGDAGDTLLNLLVDYTHGFVFSAAAAPTGNAPTSDDFLRSLDWLLARAASV